MIYWLAGYVLCGVICYIVGLNDGLRFGAIVTYRMMRDGLLAKGPKWPATVEGLDKLLEDLRR